MNAVVVETKPEQDGCEFPKSYFYIQAFPLTQKTSTDDDMQALMDRLVQGATEYGCVCSTMCMLGEFHSSHHQKVHLASYRGF